MRDFSDELKKVIAIRSVSQDGNEELANYLHDRMKQVGLKAQLQHVTHSLEGVSKRQFNVIGILGDPLVDRKTRKGLLLNTHIDTVGPGLVTNWTETGGDPFRATVKEGRIYGLGAADVKLDFLCKLRAIEKFREKKLKQPIYLVGSCGEELGMFGTKYLIQSGALNPKFVVIAEPSELAVVYAHKSLNIFRVNLGFQRLTRDAKGFNRRIQITSYGRSAHGAYPHKGMNAVHQLIDLIRDSIDQGYEMKFTRLEGGETINKVADRAVTEFYLTSHQFEDYKRYFKDLVAQTGMEHAFELDFGGLSETGIQFIPDAVFECSTQVTDYFRKMASDFLKVTDPSFNPPTSTVNLGYLKQTAMGLEFGFDLRVLPDQDGEGLEKAIREHIDHLGKNYPLLTLKSARVRTNPGLDMTPEHELVRICKDALIAAGLPVKLDKKSTSTEASQYSRAGYEAVVFGAGVSLGNSHGPNEHNVLEQMDQATLFYEKLIERVCL